jgi:hypothetical protein
MSELISFIEVAEAYKRSTEHMTPECGAWAWEMAFAEEILKITAPEGYETWREAAIDERIKRVALQLKLREVTEIAKEIQGVGFDPNPTHRIYFFNEHRPATNESATSAVTELETFWSTYFGALYKRCRDNGTKLLEVINRK